MKTVKIGILCPMTGVYGASGIVTVQDSRIAIDEINAKGGFVVNGQRYMLEGVEYDDRTDAKREVAGASYLTEMHNVKFINGTIISAGTFAAQAITEPRGVFIFTTSATHEICVRDNVHYTFRTTTSSPMRGRIGGPFWYNELEVRHVVTMMENQTGNRANANGCMDGFKAAGGTVDWIAEYEPTTQDFSTILAKARSYNPDALIMGCSSGEGALIAKQRGDMGWQVLMLGCPSESAAAEAIRTAGSKYEPSIAYFSPNPYAMTPELMEAAGIDEVMFNYHKDEFIKRHGPGNLAAGSGYDMIYLFVDIMQRAGTVDDSPALLKAAEQSQMKGAGQKWSFDPWHQCYSVQVISEFFNSDVGADKLTPYAVAQATDTEQLVWEYRTIVPKIPTVTEYRARYKY